MSDARRQEAASRRAICRVNGVPQAFDLVIDEPSTQLARLMSDHRTASATFITACNPYGAASTDSLNNSFNAELLFAILESDAIAFDGEGIDSTGFWPPEPAFLALGMSFSRALELGVRFRQTALVHATVDAIPRLIWLPLQRPPIGTL